MKKDISWDISEDIVDHTNNHLVWHSVGWLMRRIIENGWDSCSVDVNKDFRLLIDTWKKGKFEGKSFKWSWEPLRILKR